MLATAAGLTVAQHKPDIDGIDFQFRRPGPVRRRYSPCIDVQVKTTSRPRHRGGALLFDGLSATQFNKLAGADYTLPRYLFVVVVPPDAGRYADLSPNGLLLRHVCYYVSLRDQPRLPAERKAATVALPTANVLTVERLSALVDAAAT